LELSEDLSRTKLVVHDESAPTHATSISRAQFSIASTERDTGIPKETLRVWERRYGFPAPSRNAQDERVYSIEDLEKLRLVKRLIAAGHRPGKILQRDLAELIELAPSANAFPSEDVRQALEFLTGDQLDTFAEILSKILARDGLRSFVLDTGRALSAAVGEAWARDELRIHQEHYFTEVITGLIRTAIGATRMVGRRPRVLLTTFPNEPHTLGLLMAEAMFVISGCDCVSLGAQTPLSEIALAADAHQADLIGLSFSSMQGANRLTKGLNELRALTPSDIEIWAGGNAKSLATYKSPGVRVLLDLEKIPEAIEVWRRGGQST